MNKYTLKSSGVFQNYQNEYAFSNNTCFITGSGVTSPPYYWEITFESPILVNKYSVCTQYPSGGLYVSSWDVSVSTNDNPVSHLQTNSIKMSSSDAHNYSLPNATLVKKFRITMKTTSNGYGWLAISKFALFAPFVKKYNTININRFWYQTISDILILMMPSFIT